MGKSNVLLLDLSDVRKSKRPRSCMFLSDLAQSAEPWLAQEALSTSHERVAAASTLIYPGQQAFHECFWACHRRLGTAQTRKIEWVCSLLVVALTMSVAMILPNRPRNVHHGTPLLVYSAISGKGRT